MKNYLETVYKLIEVKYEIPKDVMLAYVTDIEFYMNNGFSARRTTEVLAQKILDLKQ